MMHYGSENYDSLHPNLVKGQYRQAIYHNLDIYGYFVAEMKPVLDSMNISIVNLEHFDLQTMTFITGKDTSVYNVKFITQQDGIILFNTKGEPKFWTYKNKMKCAGNDLVLEYFK